jgi:hypothetical protein
VRAYTNAPLYSQNVTGMPAGARYVLADIYVTEAAPDAIVWWSAERGRERRLGREGVEKGGGEQN